MAQYFHATFLLSNNFHISIPTAVPQMAISFLTTALIPSNHDRTIKVGFVQVMQIEQPSKRRIHLDDCKHQLKHYLGLILQISNL
ncbi:hypothetical protein T4B_4223 [Trichinella pseudospiralis]|uniref:Uncharacterized protein n=1 Tax=Trichinella pseudospiralis TaxID=6337 RepID=A0A0V1IY99_TRIPS|nr:hypothetical protein T4B_4223 [Trichinella pseudospiralis]